MDVISRRLNISLACSAENVWTHCFELLRLTAVSCEKSIGKEQYCPQTIMLHVMSVKGTGHDFHE